MFPTKRSPAAAVRRLPALVLVLGGTLTLFACSEDGAGPDGGEPRSLSLEVPEFVSDGQSFQLKVTVHGGDASTPLSGFSGTAALSVSSGTISPASVAVSGGMGQAQVTVSGAADDVMIHATLAALAGSAPIRVVAAGRLLAGAPGAPAEGAIQSAPFTARGSDYSDEHPDLPGVVLSFNTLVLAFEVGTTVGEANAILGPLDAEIVGGIRGVSGQAAGMLFLRLASTGHQDMQAVLDELRSRPEILAAAQDAVLETRAVSESNGGSPADWTWTSDPAGGNWGLELIRVPQVWNLLPAIDKGTPPSVRTGVLDAGFADDHPDVKYAQNLSAGTTHDHGTHVAGIIGATFNRGDNKTGIDGINPFAKLVVKASQTQPAGAGQLARGASWGQAFVSELDALLRSQPNLKVLNISMGYPWSPPEVNTSTNAVAQNLVRAQGVFHKALLALLEAEGVTLPLIVTAAGNESGSTAQEAKYGSPMNYAALELGVPNSIVVEALDRSSGSPGGATRRASSNRNGHLSAPGGEISSTVLPPALYGTKSGTSMAAPHVAGLAGLLLAVDPGLTTAQLWELLLSNTVPVAGGASPRVDAYAAVMDIDRLRGDHDVLRMLVDVDDGTVDGNLRVDPSDDSGVDYTEDDADEDGGIGDGDVDMSDFRRWRDGYLALAFSGIEGAIDLDGGDTHAKKDLNGNGKTESEGDDESIYPFVDLNGDNLTDNSAADVPGLGSVTDLDMLEELFDDPHYDKADLEDLLLSADIAIHPAEIFDEGEAVDIHSSIWPKGMEEAEDDVRYRRIHTGDEDDGEGLWQVYTVPTSDESYTVRIVAMDALGDTLYDLDREFEVTPGQDHYWNPDPNPAMCPVPPEWAVPYINDESEKDEESGEPLLDLSLSYNHVRAHIRAKSTQAGRAWHDVYANVQIVDYIAMIPERGWPSDGRIFLDFHHVGSAEATRENAYVSNGLCYGDDSEIQVSLGNGYLSAEPSCGELTDSASIDEVRSIDYLEWNYDPEDPDELWQEFWGGVDGWVRVRGLQRTAEAKAELRITYLGARDSDGNAVPVLLCTASGTVY